MKVAYITTYDSNDIHAWSGLGNYILRSLQGCDLTVKSVGSLRDTNDLKFKIKNKLYSKILQKRYMRDREPKVAKNYATQLEHRLASIHHDIVFSPGTIPIAHLVTKKPIIIWTDATFAGLIEFYPDYSNLCAETIKDGNRMEQLALSKCRLAIYSSEWAATTAINNYDVDPNKVRVVPFGANVNCDRKLEDIELIIKQKKFDTCKLIFVGVDWYRKGGDVALGVAKLLNERGIKTELHIVGCSPAMELPDFVKLHGFISKQTEEGRRAFDKLMTESHFLILPSKAECCAVVFAEASSYGLPSLATNVGGIPTAIRDGKNGHTFPLNISNMEYAECIHRYMSSKPKYDEISFSSFREYTERLNWLSAGHKVYDLMQKFCG